MHYKRVIYSPLETRSDAYIQNGMQSLCKFLHTTPTPKQLYKLDVIVFRGLFFFKMFCLRLSFRKKNTLEKGERGRGGRGEYSVHEYNIAFSSFDVFKCFVLNQHNLRWFNVSVFITIRYHYIS